MISVNPASLEVIAKYQPLKKSEILNKINSTHDEFLSWKDISIDKRKDILIKISDELLNNVDYHASIITSEMGKPIRESRLEVEKCAWVCKYYAENADVFLERKVIKTDASLSYLSYEPLGVVFGVMPWNFPYWQVFRFIAPSLIAGNVCLVKHASNVSGCALAIEKLVKKKCEHKNIFNVLLIDSSMVSFVIENNHIKAVTLTGSEDAGSSVAMIAGREIKKTLLELGGSDPFIVLPDANIDDCVKKGVISRFLNAGQSCIAAKRFIVDSVIYDEFIDKMLIEIKKLKLGDPMDESTSIGPLAKKEFVDEISELVDSSVNQGARLIYGGKRDGGYYSPALLVDVNEDMDVFKKETFGPVMCISKSKDEDHAITLANNSVYGLSASLWTADKDKALELSQKINSGAVFINDMSKSDPRLPFGGINKSGYGRELSELGLKEFLNIKTVVLK